MDGSLNIYNKDYIVEKQEIYVTGVAQNTAARNRLWYPMIAPDPAAVASTPRGGGALVDVATWADGSARLY
jgi:hypothetical protein